jgi:hypothetical protein
MRGKSFSTPKGLPMDDRLMREILMSHADGLNAGQDRSQDFLAMFPAHSEELASLFRMAGMAKRLLAPVQPSASCRQYIGDSLTQLTTQQVAHSSMMIQPNINRELVIRAAAAGSALAGAGLLALIWRSWIHRPQTTSSMESRSAA